MAPALAQGGVVAERYQVSRLLSTRMLHGLTFHAQDRQGGAHVVLKELRDDLRVTPDARTEFQEELQTLATLQVPGVPAARGMVVHEGRRYLVLEYVQGKTLRSLLQKQQRLPIEQAAQVFKAVLRILDGLHNQFPPLLHLDVTPDNILLAGWDKAYLLDGSYLKSLGNPFPQRAPFFTPEYAAPEVARGQGCPASDLYALGVTMAETITGTPASGLFQSGVARVGWEPLPDAGMQAILSRLVEPGLNARFGGAQEVLQALANPAAAQAAAGPGPKPGFGAPIAGPQAPAQPQQPAPPPAYARPTLTAAAQQEVARQAPAPEPPAPPRPRKELKDIKPVADIDDVSTEEGLEALMALYENQNS
jgi:serine/threonine-protein kinase